MKLLGSVAEQGNLNREQAKTDYGRLLDAHHLATGSVSKAWMRNNGKPSVADIGISQRLVLCASFFQGISLCETSISEGLYVQASALLKQEIETLAAIQECQQGKRQHRKTPNVKNVRWHMKKTYEELNHAAHVADEQLLNKRYKYDLTAIERPVNKDAVPVSLVPIYERGVATNLYVIHVIFIILYGLEVHQLFLDMYDNGLDAGELLALRTASLHVKEEGFLREVI